MDDLELINRLRNGDENAFRMVVAQYQRLVLNCTYKFLRNRESSEDITQEVFLEVYKSIHAFRADSKLSTWIYRIAISKSLNFLKSQKRKKRFAIVTGLFDDNGNEKQIPTPENMNPEIALENRDRANALAWALAKIPDNQRIAFTLSKYQEMNYEEISLIMDTTISSVESLLHRAKTNLKKILINYYKKHL